MITMIMMMIRSSSRTTSRVVVRQLVDDVVRRWRRRHCLYHNSRRSSSFMSLQSVLSWTMTICCQSGPVVVAIHADTAHRRRLACCLKYCWLQECLRRSSSTMAALIPAAVVGMVARWHRAAVAERIDHHCLHYTISTMHCCCSTVTRL